MTLTGKTKAQIEAEKQKTEAIQRIQELKRILQETDYVVIKIAEGVSDTSQYADVLEKRQQARQEIKELEQIANS